MASKKKKRSHQLELTVTWMLGCLVLLIANSTIFKSYDADVGDPWFNLLLSAAILALLFKIAAGFLQLQKDLKRTNSQIDRVDKLDHEGFARYMARVFGAEGWKVEMYPSEADGASLRLVQGDRRVHAVFHVGRRRLTREYVRFMLGKIPSEQGTFRLSEELWLLTNSSFTTQARREAARARIRLLDREGLINLLVKADPVSILPARRGRAAE